MPLTWVASASGFKVPFLTPPLAGASMQTKNSQLNVLPLRHGVSYPLFVISRKTKQTKHFSGNITNIFSIGSINTIIKLQWINRSGNQLTKLSFSFSSITAHKLSSRILLSTSVYKTVKYSMNIGNTRIIKFTGCY